MKTEKKAALEALIEARSQRPTNEVIQRALLAQKKRLEEEQETALVEQLADIDNDELRLIEQVRAIRKLEKMAMKNLSIFNEAKEKFMVDADYDEFKKMCREMTRINIY